MCYALFDLSRSFDHCINTINNTSLDIRSALVSLMAQFTRFPTVLSKTPAEARSRVLGLYRMFLRESPLIIVNYELPFSLRTVRARVRQEFEKFRGNKRENAPRLSSTTSPIECSID